MSEGRREKCERFVASSSHELCEEVELWATDPLECAKLLGIVLFHFGHIQPYGSGLKPEAIEVRNKGLTVHFNVWYASQQLDGKLMSIIKAESIFVKRDLSISSSQECVPVTIQSSNFDLTGDKPLDILRGIFKFQGFRGLQRKVIDSIHQGKNTFVVLPTGGGKTICYAVPSLMVNKTSVVIFPILSLLFDQVERLRSQGLNVCYLMAEMDDKEKENIMHKLTVDPPEYNFLFLTPETILTPSVFELLKIMSSRSLLNFLVIDEAHCIDTWGFHFRKGC